MAMHSSHMSGSGAQQIPQTAQSVGGISGLGGLKKKTQRLDEVNDAFYEQFVYENLECIIRTY